MNTRNVQLLLSGKEAFTADINRFMLCSLPFRDMKSDSHNIASIRCGKSGSIASEASSAPSHPLAEASARQSLTVGGLGGRGQRTTPSLNAQSLKRPCWRPGAGRGGAR